MLASTLAAAAIAGALVYVPNSPIGVSELPVASSAVEVFDPETAQPLLISPAAPGANASASVPAQSAASQDVQSLERPAADMANRLRPPRDEATVLADLRKRANQDIQESYSLLLDELGLTPQERADLTAVLVELQVDSAWAGSTDGGGYQKRGRTIGPRERHERIAAVVGDQKLDEFLLLESNASEYYETYQIASLMRRKQLPLTERQRDGVFDILVEVRRYRTELPPEIDPGSIERVAHTIKQHDEHDRHVVELASSVLTPTQVVHLFEQYQRMAAQRAWSLEHSKKLSAENPKLVFYTPGSWQ